MIGLLKIRGRGVLRSVEDSGGWGCWWEVRAGVFVSVCWVFCVGVRMGWVWMVDATGGAVLGTPSSESIGVSRLSLVLIVRGVVSGVP